MQDLFRRISQQSCAREVAPVAVGAARSLCAASSAQVLRVSQGSAWVTLGQGPHFEGRSAEVTGDWVLHAGQSVALPAGCRVVLQAMGGEPLHYRLQAPSEVVRPRPLLHWWQRAQVGPCGDEVCCA